MWVKGIGQEHDPSPPLPLDAPFQVVPHAIGHTQVPTAELLYVRLVLTLPQGTHHVLRALVDTGAEYNLCRRGLLPDTA